ncbi:hypothetical protein BD309DRAFT_645567 [Dichomitus squalens]|uniref:Uncharacterized protein n=1 Tax=Dichomitus squalens TaxID=114155 RepID=A0A4Q9NZL2_9APHY|nr:hypothetical protein BD309DRAFT_645567 [Dichomitus squalens]TBU57363.1 hypothetical protein BD310DRAFT_929554 [Dichomitus squalens]
MYDRLLRRCVCACARCPLQDMHRTMLSRYANTHAAFFPCAGARPGFWPVPHYFQAAMPRGTLRPPSDETRDVVNRRRAPCAPTPQQGRMTAAFGPRPASSARARSAERFFRCRTSRPQARERDATGKASDITRTGPTG